METVAIIMAGGKGERFWPRSRVDKPKQFLSLTSDGKTMLQKTVERILPIVEMKNIFVVTNPHYKGLVQEQLADLSEENILLEPMAKNTAPCIGLAAAYVSARYKEAVMVVLPADHLIKYTQLFADVATDSIHIAQQTDALVTIGMTPFYPETGYGYIELGEKSRHFPENVYKVRAFVEKPDLETAKLYLDSGRYLWNSGMFIWKATSILKAFETYLPEMAQGIAQIKSYLIRGEKDKIKEVFEELEAVSIDYGIMEKADNIYTLVGNFGWNDVGSWLALETVKPSNDEGNIIEGNVVTINTKNTIVQGDEKLIALVGMENAIVVDTKDALLICNKENAQNVKQVIETLRASDKKDYL